MMQQRQQQHKTGPQGDFFTASEVAEYEYCPLAWWFEHYDPRAQADTEELFARLVELEHDSGQQAPMLPEYQMIEQLLLRRGAFDEGQQQHRDHADEIEEIEEERANVPAASPAASMRILALVALAVLVLALLFIVAAVVVR